MPLSCLLLQPPFSLRLYTPDRLGRFRRTWETTARAWRVEQRLVRRVYVHTCTPHVHHHCKAVWYADRKIVHCRDRDKPYGIIIISNEHTLSGGLY
jgi:hypothetical protein